MTLCADCGKSTGRPIARFCDPCRPRHRGKRPRWVWTEGRIAYVREHYRSDRGVPPKVAKALGFPRHVVSKKAAELGITRDLDKRRWTEAEESFLMEHAGTRTLQWMAKRLGRTLASVALKIKREHLSRRVSEGYTLRELELCFGVSHRVIRAWVEQGRLRQKKRGIYFGAREAWAVTDGDLLRFVLEHPTAFDLHRVDQHWFMGLVRGSVEKAMRRAEAA